MILRRFYLLILVFSFLLQGCTKLNASVDRAISLRQQLLSGQGCCFDASVTADYGTEIYTFSLKCTYYANGVLDFLVLTPDSVAGIAGKIDETGAYLTVDDHALAFPMLADNQITPVTAPWVIFRALRSGFLSACGEEDALLRVKLDDSYEENALEVDVWLNQENLPVHGEILWDSRRILSVTVENFHFL